MTICVAKGCKNTSNKLVKMNYFPKDPGRRKIWTRHCQVLGGMVDWSPNAHSALCEFHFLSGMWKRNGTKKKLKNDAVPTIFGKFVHQVQISVVVEKQTVENDEMEATDSKALIESERRDDDSRIGCVSYAQPRNVNRIIINPRVHSELLEDREISSIVEGRDQKIVIDVRAPSMVRTEYLASAESIVIAVRDTSPSKLVSSSRIPHGRERATNESGTSSFENINRDDRSSDDEMLNRDRNLSKDSKELSVRSRMSEKFERLERLYLKNARLRRLLQLNDKKKQFAFQNRIRKLIGKLAN